MSTNLKKAGLFNQNLMNALQKMGIMTPGDIYFLDPANGDDTYDGMTIDRAFKSLAVAEDALTANQHDVLVYISGATSLSLSAKLVWDKDYTHFIGVSAGVPMAKRSRVFHSANFSPMIEFSANGCIWSNLYFSYGRGGADNHVLMALTGDRNVFENIHFAAMNHQTEADDAASVGVEMTGAHENLFKDCVFGNDTIERGAANATLSMVGDSARNKVSNCLFESWADAATPVAIKVAADGVDRFLWLEDVLIANHGTSLTQAIDSNITDTSARKVYVSGEFNTIGCTDVADATGDGTIFVKSPTTTANALGLAINPAVS